MNTDLERLIELEKVDREIARLTDEVAALPRRVAAIEEKLAEHKAAVEKANTQIKANEAGRRQVWGATFQTANKKQNMVGEVANQFDQLLEWLSEETIDRLQEEPSPNYRVSLFGFPAQMARLKPIATAWARDRACSSASRCRT